jgi:hypothetical protein
MILRSWLASLFVRLTSTSSHRSVRRRRTLTKRYSTTPQHVELLEQRAMLTPTLTALEPAPLNYLQHSIPPISPVNNITPVSNLITVNDPGVQIQGATVAISGNFQTGQDQLNFANLGGITGTWDAATGILTLAGAASAQTYTTALQSVAYTNLSFSPILLNGPSLSVSLMQTAMYRLRNLARLM